MKITVSQELSMNALADLVDGNTSPNDHGLLIVRLYEQLKAHDSFFVEAVDKALGVATEKDRAVLALAERWQQGEDVEQALVGAILDRKNR